MLNFAFIILTIHGVKSSDGKSGGGGDSDTALTKVIRPLGSEIDGFL